MASSFATLQQDQQAQGPLLIDKQRLDACRDDDKRLDYHVPRERGTKYKTGNLTASLYEVEVGEKDPIRKRARRALDLDSNQDHFKPRDHFKQFFLPYKANSEFELFRQNRARSEGYEKEDCMGFSSSRSAPKGLNHEDAEMEEISPDMWERFDNENNRAIPCVPRELPAAKASSNGGPKEIPDSDDEYVS